MKHPKEMMITSILFKVQIVIQGPTGGELILGVQNRLVG
jgi:hypothetical protein